LFVIVRRKFNTRVKTLDWLLQSNFRALMPRAGIWLALTAIGISAWYLFRSGDDAAMDVGKAAVELPKDETPVRTAPDASEQAQATPSLESPMPQVKAAPATENEPSVRDLEARFRTTKVTQEQTAILEQIAGFNDAAAVECLARLFHQQSHPAVKEALLAALGDIDPREAPETRQQLLATASRGEARNVRRTALHLLDALEDPRGAELIRDLMKNDPDRQVREEAAALLRERAEDADP
jgi:hypothetical protein